MNPPHAELRIPEPQSVCKIMAFWAVMFKDFGLLVCPFLGSR